MDLQDYRKQIDAIDTQLVDLFARRMEVAAGIAMYKLAQGLPVLDASREHAKLQQVAAMAPQGMEDYTAQLYTKLFELSRNYQEALLRQQPGEGEK